MKKLIILSLVCALAMVFTIPTAVLAAEPETLPEPGMTPDSPFYFMDKWGKQIAMMFTFKAESKVQLALHYAEERLAEAEAMAEQNKIRAMERAEYEYHNCLAIATRNMEKLMAKGVSTSEQVATKMSNHIALMYQYTNQQQNNTCEDCQQIRQQIRERAMTCQEAAVQALASQDPEAALQLNVSLMQQMCNQIQNMIGQGDDAPIQEALRYYESLRTRNQEMLANAEQFGLGSETQQMVQEATQNQDGLLYQIRNQLQIHSGDSTEAPVQNSIQQQQSGTTTDGGATTDSGNGGTQNGSPGYGQ